MHLTLATEKHLPEILDIMNEAILNTTAVYDYKERSLDYVEKWFEAKTMARLPVWVAEIEGHVVGYASFGIFRAWDAYQFSVEHSIYVHKNFQKRGIGKKLLKSLILEATNEGYHTMIAGIDASNAFSMEFHKRAGFLEVGRLYQVGYKFDKWLDLVFMQLMLTPHHSSEGPLS